MESSFGGDFSDLSPGHRQTKLVRAEIWEVNVGILARVGNDIGNIVFKIAGLNRRITI